MDGGPFRVPQPADNRRVPARPESRSEPTSWQPEEQPQPVKVEPKPVHRTLPPVSTAKEKSSKRFLLPIIAFVVLAIILVAGFFAWQNSKNTAMAIDSSKYQSVFFTNGQVYFGKLKPFNDEYMKLTDVYYLQTQATGDDSENPQQTTNSSGDVKLIKLGDEIHGPEDEMVISKSQVLFYENLKTDGKVAQSIATFKKAN